MSATTTRDFEPDLYSLRTGVSDPLINQARRILSSAVLLIIAYVLAFLLHQYVTGGLCRAFGYPPLIGYNYIGNLPFDYHDWSLKRITLIFSAGPVVCLIAGIFLLDLFVSLRRKGTLGRCFILWLVVCLFNLFFAFLLFSPLAVENYTSNLYTGFSIVGAWWRMGRLAMIPLSFLAMSGSILAGYILGGHFLKFSFSRTILDSFRGRKKMIFQLFVMPVIIAAPVLFLLTNESSFLVHCFHLLNMVIIGVGMFLGMETTNIHTKVYGKDVLNTIPVAWLIILVALLFFISKILK